MNETITINGKERKVSEWSLVTGCWDQAQVAYESHRRGKNWTATVKCNKAAPGGMDRNFWSHGSGSYVVPACTVGDYLEVAADYYTASGGKRSDRHYFRVLEINSERIVVRESGTPPAKPGDVDAERFAAGLVDTAPETPNPLAGFSDEDIMAEAARRGLVPAPAAV